MTLTFLAIALSYLFEDRDFLVLYRVILSRMSNFSGPIFKGTVSRDEFCF
jgi:hypothetical protein